MFERCVWITFTPSSHTHYSRPKRCWNTEGPGARGFFMCRDISPTIARESGVHFKKRECDRLQCEKPQELRSIVAEAHARQLREVACFRHAGATDWYRVPSLEPVTKLGPTRMVVVR